MNIGSVLRKVGGSILKNAVPGGGLLIDLVNGFLPEDKKLDTGATGEQALNAIEALPPEQKASLLEKELDVEIEEIRSWASIQDSLAKADAVGASTRPRIAMMMAWVVVVLAVVFVVVWGNAVVTKDGATLTVLSNSWELMLTVLATPTALLRAYFGMRTSEKKARYQLAAGQSPQSVLSSIKSMFK